MTRSTSNYQWKAAVRDFFKEISGKTGKGVDAIRTSTKHPIRFYLAGPNPPPARYVARIMLACIYNHVNPRKIYKAAFPNPLGSPSAWKKWTEFRYDWLFTQLGIDVWDFRRRKVDFLDLPNTRRALYKDIFVDPRKGHIIPRWERDPIQTEPVSRTRVTRAPVARTRAVRASRTSTIPDSDFMNIPLPSTGVYDSTMSDADFASIPLPRDDVADTAAFFSSYAPGWAEKLDAQDRAREREDDDEFIVPQPSSKRRKF